MTLSVEQESHKIEMVGTVTPPPTITSILDRLADAVKVKATVELSPGEVRVLSDYLAGLT